MGGFFSMLMAWIMSIMAIFGIGGTTSEPAPKDNGGEVVIVINNYDCETRKLATAVMKIGEETVSFSDATLIAGFIVNGNIGYSSDEEYVGENIDLLKACKAVLEENPVPKGNYIGKDPMGTILAKGDEFFLCLYR